MTAYLRPETLDEALAIRARADVLPLAGGTDVYPAKVARAGWGDMTHKDVLDLSGIAALRGIAETEDGWRFGALATWTQIAEAALPPQLDGLRRAAREIGGVQIQNRGTLAGNLCTASPAGDGAPNLLALDAQVELASLAGVRRLPVASFVSGYRRTACRPDELVTAVLVPRLAGPAAATFLKLGARRYLVISIAMVAGVAACDAAGRILDVRLAVGACSATPQRLAALEAALLGEPIASAASRVMPAHLGHLAPIDDVRGSAAYRREAALALVRDALHDLSRADARRAA
ncbi:MAG: FAD binding domain-containing protein [Hyphomicrobiaceae bacterium]|nr:FAD binding domain-containing protein [Hyphomicrobiaceae bacterium]